MKNTSNCLKFFLLFDTYIVRNKQKCIVIRNGNHFLKRSSLFAMQDPKCISIWCFRLFDFSQTIHGRKLIAFSMTILQILSSKKSQGDQSYMYIFAASCRSYMYINISQNKKSLSLKELIKYYFKLQIKLVEDG